MHNNIAVHPAHGVVWTDGKAIYLAPIKLQGNQLQNAVSVKLGEFEHVSSIHWSRDIKSEYCYLCVVHLQNVTVWKVSGTQPKLSFKQVRKINVKPIPQGCLWNPVSDLLCLVSRQQCSFYYRHDQDKGSFGFPSLESNQISCGCWSTDGNKLVLCVGAVLLIYRWSDVTKSIDKFAATAWQIPGLDGHIISISSAMKDSVVVAAEVPLEALFKQQDTLKMPDIIGEALTKDDIIQPKLSVTSSLFNLQFNQTGAQTGSSLNLINLMDGNSDPVCLSSVPLKGVLSPDVILFERHSQCVVVGSNSQSQLHIFVLLDKHLAYCGDIQLEKSQRPKGLCSMSTYVDDHGAALLILVGQREQDEAGFLSPSLDADYKLTLKYIILKSDHERVRKKGNRTSAKSKSSLGIIKADSMRDQTFHIDPKLVHRCNSLKTDQLSVDDDIKCSHLIKEDNSLVDGSQFHLTAQEGLKDKMIEEINDSSEPLNRETLELQTVDFSHHDPCFHNSKLLSQYELNNPNESEEQLQHVFNQVNKEIGTDHTCNQRKVSSMAVTSDFNNSECLPTKELAASKSEDSFEIEIKSSDLPHVIIPATKFDNHLSNLIVNYNDSTSKLPELLYSNVSSDSALLEEMKQINMSTEFSQQNSASSITDNRSIKNDLYTSEFQDAFEHTFQQESLNNTSSQSDSLELKTQLLDSLEQRSQLQVSLEHKTQLQDSLEQRSQLQVSLEHKTQLQDSLEHKFQLQDSLEYKSQPQDSLEQKSQLLDSLEQKSQLQESLEYKSQPQDSLEQKSQLQDSLEQKTQLQDSLEYKSQPQDSLEQKSQLQDSLEQKTQLQDSLEYKSQPQDSLEQKSQLLDSLEQKSQLQETLVSGLDDMELQIKAQKDSLNALHQRLQSIAQSVEESQVSTDSNQRIDLTVLSTETIEITCEKPLGVEKKIFLLDNGHLHLETVKLAFGLATVELDLGGSSCVLCANVDGFIPLKFSPHSNIKIKGQIVKS
ncbi:WD repeat and coiled-coil-containing protein-like isoform X3 [Biomphalaria glabrata]|uniref:WD repeat and coiled-coil-containing protein n=1 Tax=Biomphalaria glabrata TaxID=6526 RepID=A0A9U8E2X9_BIOGL|nr:WD repeat and coiled-coil-containing protein-like isoform X3 [Biomphalaria glabrata]